MHRRVYDGDAPDSRWSGWWDGHDERMAAHAREVARMLEWDQGRTGSSTIGSARQGVVCDGRYFDSVQEASVALHVSEAALYAALRKRRGWLPVRKIKVRAA